MEEIHTEMNHSDVILDRWARLNEKGDVDEETLVHFVSQYFDEPGSELECIYPTDFKDKVGDDISSLLYF